MVLDMLSCEMGWTILHRIHSNKNFAGNTLVDMLASVRIMLA